MSKTKRTLTLVAAIAFGAFAITGSAQGAPITNTWTGAADADWQNAANWSGGVVPVDQQLGSANWAQGLSGQITLVFDGPMPAGATFPDYDNGAVVSLLQLGGSHNGSPVTRSTPLLILNKGGTLPVKYVGKDRYGIFVHPLGDYTPITVGDGVGGVGEDVTLDVTGPLTLAYDEGGTNFTYTAIVNSDGTLDVQNDFRFFRDVANNQAGVVDVNGGTFLVGGKMTSGFNATGGQNAGALDSKVILRDDGTVTVAGVLDNVKDYDLAGTKDVLFDFTGTGTLTALFGGEFADIATVNAAIGEVFLSSTGLTVTATDNLDDTYTVSAAPAAAAPVPEPATMGLLALAATGLGGYLRRRRRA